MEGIKDFIIEKIEEISFATVTESDSLWAEKVLDSITIIELIVELESKYGVKIPNSEIIEDHFETVLLLEKYLLGKI